ncbi:MAG: SRPBCC family protein [Prevotellaceae bacterium]|jgi:hypothetical protein|nr:SRPBCC family protein [Prevotellaceae bacterium]
MTTYESKVTTIQLSQNQAFVQLSDLRNLEKFKQAIPEQYLSDFVCGENFASTKTPQFGNVTLRIIEREADKTIKFAVENLPIQANIWVQLKEISPLDTKMKLTIKAEIPFFLKSMIGNKLQQGIDKMADTLTFALNKI